MNRLKKTCSECEKVLDKLCLRMKNPEVCEISILYKKGGNENQLIHRLKKIPGIKQEIEKIKQELNM